MEGIKLQCSMDCRIKGVFPSIVTPEVVSGLLAYCFFNKINHALCYLAFGKATRLFSKQYDFGYIIAALYPLYFTHSYRGIIQFRSAFGPLHESGHFTKERRPVSFIRKFFLVGYQHQQVPLAHKGCKLFPEVVGRDHVRIKACAYFIKNFIYYFTAEWAVHCHKRKLNIHAVSHICILPVKKVPQMCLYIMSTIV